MNKTASMYFTIVCVLPLPHCLGNKGLRHSYQILFYLKIEDLFLWIQKMLLSKGLLRSILYKSITALNILNPIQ